MAPVWRCLLKPRTSCGNDDSVSKERGMKYRGHCKTQRRREDDDGALPGLLKTGREHEDA
jgi:hypothetical protein